MTIKILVLEDNLEALAAIMNSLAALENELSTGVPFMDIAVTVLSTFEDVEKFINNSETNYDVILLDRDCKLGGSFHVLRIESVGPQKIIAISMVEPYNQEAAQRGVERVVLKDYGNLERFANEVCNEIRQIVAEHRTDNV